MTVMEVMVISSYCNSLSKAIRKQGGGNNITNTDEKKRARKRKVDFTEECEYLGRCTLK